jgi:ATP diphosphatase
LRRRALLGVRRHPHVFGHTAIASVSAQNEAWEAHKAAERQARGEAGSVLDGVALALPALLRAAKISRRAARIGPDLDALEELWEQVKAEEQR